MNQGRMVIGTVSEGTGIAQSQIGQGEQTVDLVFPVGRREEADSGGWVAASGELS